MGKILLPSLSLKLSFTEVIMAKEVSNRNPQEPFHSVLSMNSITIFGSMFVGFLSLAGTSCLKALSLNFPLDFVLLHICQRMTNSTICSMRDWV